MPCFRQCASLLALLANLCVSSPLRRQDDECRRTQVLVLGGGIAGITAAQTLANNSITDFVIVEYNGELGGRVAHTTFGAQPDGTPYVVELGANWVQGLQTDDGPVNPIWTLAQKYKLNNTYSDYDKILTYNETGYVNYTDVFDDLDVAYGEYEIDAGYTITDNLQDMSVQSALAMAEERPSETSGRMVVLRLGVFIPARGLQRSLVSRELQYHVLSMER
jgi:polyamine oxidase